MGCYERCSINYALFLYNSTLYNIMKTHITLLAVGLLSAGLVKGQNNGNPSPSVSTTTTSSSTYRTSPVTTDSSNAVRSTYSTSPSSESNTMGTMNSTGNANMNSNGNMNSTGNANMNTTAPATNGYTTTTTTTTTADYNANTAAPAGQKSDRAWGKDGKFGAYAGVNFSRFVNEPIPDGAYRAGWQAGIYGRTAGTVFGQIGLEYRNSTSNLVRSGAGQPTQTPGEIRGQINQHFVAIPAYVGVRIGSALGLRLQAGAELAALVVNPNNKFGIGNDDFRRTILNGLLGAGINLGPLTLDAVYNAGLQNVFENADTKRHVLAFNLGFRF